MIQKWLIFLLLLIMVSQTALARAPRVKRKIPLLPPRDISFNPEYVKVSKARHVSRSSSTYGGMEFGSIGIQNSTNSDVLGLKLLWGGRLFTLHRIMEKVQLKPSLGLFFRNEGVGKPSVTQFLAEGGVTIQYQVINAKNFKGSLGIGQKFDLNFSVISIPTVSGAESGTGATESSPIQARYRLGPTLNFLYALSRTVGLVIDFETTFTVTKPTRLYGSAGMGFFLKF